ncbi:glucan phosphoethanolaminetransferase (alkaline phosphatase superfamily) [Clostridium pascui]|nr:glucan phosphoethanolaminetransferase (alkaline phosphatase superfamily) [Clostridium pascui]
MLRELNDVYKIILLGILCLWVSISIFEERFQKYLNNWIVSIVMVVVILIFILSLYDILINNNGSYIDAFFYILGIVSSIRYLLKSASRKY